MDIVSRILREILAGRELSDATVDHRMAAIGLAHWRGMTSRSYKNAAQRAILRNRDVAVIAKHRVSDEV